MDSIADSTHWQIMKSTDQLTDFHPFWFKVYDCSVIEGSEGNHDSGMTFVTWIDIHL
jgi:hypothetical protein